MLLNAAFLAKQAWRISQEPTRLVNQVMKARYFPNGDLFNASTGHRSFYCWRSILKGVEILKCGCDFGTTGGIKWKHSGTGQYDVRSGYEVAQHAQLSKLGDAGQCSNSKPLITFWKLPLPRKIKKIGWRCYHNSLAVGVNLHIRHLHVLTAGPLCGMAMETADHIFLKCWWASKVWNGVQIPDWHVIGNQAKHGGKFLAPNAAISRIRALAGEYYRFSRDTSINHMSCSDFEWKPPPSGVIKVNCDASWDKETNIGSVGVIARDHDTIVIAVCAINRIECIRRVDCEGIGIQEGFKLCNKLGIHKMLLESDCAKVVMGLNCRNMDSSTNSNWYKARLSELDHNDKWNVLLI
ncbi:hypothetical protein QQ045_018346 [Rhodiola kirilowii]